MVLSSKYHKIIKTPRVKQTQHILEIFCDFFQYHCIDRHTGKKIKMRCPVEGCQMVFGSQSGLWFHNQKDHLKLRHPCHICGKTYTQVNRLVGNHFKALPYYRPLFTSKKMHSKSLVYCTEIYVGNPYQAKTRLGSPGLQV